MRIIHIPLNMINLMFKNFENELNNNSQTHSKKFNPTILGIDVDSDVITATSKNTFKHKYRYELVVDILQKYFVIIGKVNI